jgi:hypothetical protein
VRSDGIGEYGELYRHAREEGCLEFAAATDHAEFFTDNAWLWMQDVTNSWNQPGSFVTLVGYETEGKQRDRNVYTSRSRLKLFRGRYPPTSSLDVVWGHFHGDENVVGGVHALLAHGVAWEHWQHHDPSVERFLEIYSMWGANDFRDGPLVPDWLDEWIAQGIIKPPMTANELLKKGAKLGFTGGIRRIPEFPLWYDGSRHATFGPHVPGPCAQEPHDLRDDRGANPAGFHGFRSSNGLHRLGTGGRMPRRGARRRAPDARRDHQGRSHSLVRRAR